MYKIGAFAIGLLCFTLGVVVIMFGLNYVNNSNKGIPIVDTTVIDVGNSLNSTYLLNPIYTQRLQNTDLMVPFVKNTDGVNLSLISADPLEPTNLKIVNSMLDSLIEANLDASVFTFIGYNEEIANILGVSSYSNVLILTIDKSPVHFFVFDVANDATYMEYKIVVDLIKLAIYQ